MTLASLPPATVAAVGLVVLVAGATNGVAGFGFAVVGTMALATLVDPATAVVFMIVPIFAVNVSLVSDLSREELRSCSARFWPLIAAALVGTVVGMAALQRVPAAPLRVGLGVLTLGFVATAQRAVPVPGMDSFDGAALRSRPGMVGVGGVSGVLFGGTNVGVQLIAYLRSFDLSHLGRRGRAGGRGRRGRQAPPNLGDRTPPTAGGARPPHARRRPTRDRWARDRVTR